MKKIFYENSTSNVKRVTYKVQGKIITKVVQPKEMLLLPREVNDFEIIKTETIE